MKNKLTLGFLAIFLTAIISSCSTSNNVVGNFGIQKRKYNKGFSISHNNNLASNSKKSNIKSTSIQNEVVDNSLNQQTIKAITIQKVTNVEDVAIVSTKQTSEIAKTSLNIKSRKYKNKNDQKELTTLETKQTKRGTLGKVKNIVKELTSKTTTPADTDTMTILLVILAIILPPLAVFLFEEASTRFWIDLVLALLGWGVFAWLLPGLVWLGGLAAIVYALLIVLDVI